MICKTRFLIQCKICKEPVVYICLRLRVATKSDKKSKNCKTLTQTPTRIQKYKRKTRDLSPDLPNKYCLDKIYPSTMELSSGLSISCSRKFLESKLGEDKLHLEKTRNPSKEEGWFDAIHRTFDEHYLDYVVSTKHPLLIQKYQNILNEFKVQTMKKYSEDSDSSISQRVLPLKTSRKSSNKSKKNNSKMQDKEEQYVHSCSGISRFVRNEANRSGRIANKRNFKMERDLSASGVHINNNKSAQNISNDSSLSQQSKSNVRYLEKLSKELFKPANKSNSNTSPPEVQALLNNFLSEISESNKDLQLQYNQQHPFSSRINNPTKTNFNHEDQIVKIRKWFRLCIFRFLKIL